MGRDGCTCSAWNGVSRTHGRMHPSIKLPACSFSARTELMQMITLCQVDAGVSSPILRIFRRARFGHSRFWLDAASE